MKNTINITVFNCPLCTTEMVQTVGNQIHPNDPKFGFGLYCPALTCSAQEVFGHGRNVLEAFEIVLDKYKK